jgi:hypothetical protein
VGLEPLTDCVIGMVELFDDEPSVTDIDRERRGE